MGFFDFMLTSSQRCEKEIHKLMNSVAKDVKSKIKDLNTNKEEDKQLIAAIVLFAINDTIDEVKKDISFQKRFNLSDSKYNEIISKALNIVIRKYTQNLDTSINQISMEATMLVAFIKDAGKGRDFIFDQDKTDKEFYDKKCDKIMTACYLMNCFCIKVCRFSRTYHLNITENGPIYGKCFEVQLGPFLQLLIDVVAKIIEDLPKVYQDKINAYMNAPFSDENIAVSKKIKQTLYPQYKSVRKHADKWRKCVIDGDYFYTLCDKIYFQ